MPATRQRRLRGKPSAAFAKLLYTARNRRGLSQQALADLASIDRATVIRWESGNASQPDPAMLRAVCAHLGLRYTDALVALGTLTADDLAPVAA